MRPKAILEDANLAVGIHFGTRDQFCAPSADAHDASHLPGSFLDVTGLVGLPLLIGGAGGRDHHMEHAVDRVLIE